MNKVNEYSSTSGIKDFFSSGDDTYVEILVTSDSASFHEKNEISHSINYDSESEIRINPYDSKIPFSVCVDLLSDPLENDKDALKCTFFEEKGKKISQKTFGKNAKDYLLTNSGLILTQKGEPHLYSIRNDTFAWKQEELVTEISSSKKRDYLLFSYSESPSALSSETINEIRKTENGEKIAEKKGLWPYKKLSANGEYVYLVGVARGSDSRTVSVFTRQFRKLQTWRNFSSGEDLDGLFFPEQNQLIIPLRTGSMFVGNYRNGNKKVIPYPSGPFTPLSFELDQRKSLLFIYGIKRKGSDHGLVKPDLVRQLFIYDLNQQVFAENFLEFKPDQYSFQSLLQPKLTVISDNLLGIKHRNHLEIYRYSLGRFEAD